MDPGTIHNLSEAISLFFPPEWVKAALVLAFFSTCVVVGVFAYLNKFTKKPYFSLWTVAWMFYAVYLAASIGLEESPDTPFLVMARRACIGISALFMFWGSFRLTNQVRSQRELGSGVVLIIIWSYVAAYHVQDQLWITMPMFVLLACAGIYTGFSYWRYRGRYRAANLLAAGFVLWGLHLLFFPFRDLKPVVEVCVYLTSAVLSVFVCMGMIVQVLEQTRERNEALLDEFKKGVVRRRLLEQEISVSEEKYRALFDSASDAIFLVDLETLHVQESNQSAQRLTDCSHEELAGRSFLDLCPNVRPRTSTPLDKIKAFGDVFKPACDFQLIRRDGTPVVCEGDSNLVQCNKKGVLQLNIREITERKHIELQLRQAEKLSALGQLIAGVAHELNNPLAVVMGYAQILAKQTTADDKTRGDAQKILHESERAAKIVRNLLTFARPREPQMVPVDVNRLIMNFLETRSSALHARNIHLDAELSTRLPRTKADINQIEQVLTNLITNAMQVLADHTGERKLTVTTEPRGDFIRIMVADSGPGIASKHLSRIFEPFFTTKTPGRGTGLGLSICHSIIEEHNGKIWVQSEINKGTRFFIELPVVLCEEPAEEPQVVMSGPEPDPLATERRILIVDDEPGIVEVLKEVLSGGGYGVETADNGLAALERIGASRFDLVISDLCMPGMNGEKLYEAIKQSQPRLASRMIFVTGDTVSPSSRAFLDATENSWLSKPFNIAEVEEVVTKVLREQARPLNEVATVAGTIA